MRELLTGIGDLQAAAALYRVDPQILYANVSSMTRASFADARRNHGTPLVIPAKNEADTLPGMLTSAALNGDIVPLVVNNQSTDATAEIAQNMGAIVLEAPKGRKMAATQAGLAFAVQELRAKTILFTDADTHLPRRWARSMANVVCEADQGRGALLFGHSIYTTEQSALAACTVNIYRTARATQRVLRSQRLPARGANYALQLDPEGVMQDAIAKLDPTLMWGDDWTIGAAIAKTGAAAVSSGDLATWVVTKGDRIATLSQIATAAIHRNAYMQKRSQAY